MYWLIMWLLLAMVIWMIFFGASTPCDDCEIHNDPEADKSYCFNCEGRKR